MTSSSNELPFTKSRLKTNKLSHCFKIRTEQCCSALYRSNNIRFIDIGGDIDIICDVIFIGFVSYNLARAFGEPHFVTVDGKNYTFNGCGWYTYFTGEIKGICVQILNFTFLYIEPLIDSISQTFSRIRVRPTFNLYLWCRVHSFLPSWETLVPNLVEPLLKVLQ